MNGIIVEKLTQGGRDIWVARDVKSHLVIEYGNSIHDVVMNYEKSIENKEMEKTLGLKLDDLSF